MHLIFCINNRFCSIIIENFIFLSMLEKNIAEKIYERDSGLKLNKFY